MRWKKESTKRNSMVAPGGSKDTEERNKENGERNPAKLEVVALLVRHCSGTSGLPNIW